MARKEKFTDEDCINALRRFEQSLKPGERASKLVYSIWQKDHLDAPTSRTLLNRFGTWNQARLHAARSPDDISLYRVGEHSRKYTDEACLDAIRHYAEEHPGEKITFSAYTVWQKERKEAPSAYTILRDFNGSWRDAVRQAISSDEHTR